MDQVLNRTQRGALPVGFRLPPTRVLAAELGVHRNTVVRAFEELQSMGLVSATVGRGSFVSGSAEPTAVPATPAAGGLPWSSILSKRLESAPLARFDRLSRTLSGVDLINLQRMQPSLDLLPVEPFRRCVDHVLRTHKGRALGYAPREGLPALREQIASLLSSKGVPARPEDVIITSGSQQALDLIARAVVDPGDSVLIEALSYSGAINLFAAAGAALIGVPSDEDGPDLAMLERLGTRGAKLFYVMPNGKNPTGTTMSSARREALIEWSRRAGVPLVEDDYVADLDLDGERTEPSLRAFDADVIHIGTFSKRLIPALRIGYCVCPAAIRSRLISLKHAADLGTSLLLQHALAEFLERGYLRAHIKRIIPEYRARRDALGEALSLYMPREIEWTSTTRGVTQWLKLPRGVDSETVFRAAEHRGVLVSPGVLSSLNEPGAQGLRLTFCAETPERLREGVKRLGKALDEVLGARPSRRPPNGPSAVLGVV